MRLTEFYALDEARSQRFVFEPETNGMGRLLAWEQVEYAADGAEEQDTGFEVVAHGDINKLLQKLAEMAPELAGQEDSIREMFEQAIDDGGLVVSVEAAGTSLIPKSPREDDGWEPVEEVE
jgi:hypothetical protein